LDTPSLAPFFVHIRLVDIRCHFFLVFVLTGTRFVTCTSKVRNLQLQADSESTADSGGDEKQDVRIVRLSNTSAYPKGDLRSVSFMGGLFIAIFEIDGARVDQTNKRIFERLPSEHIISVSRALRNMI